MQGAIPLILYWNGCHKLEPALVVKPRNSTIQPNDSPVIFVPVRGSRGERRVKKALEVIDKHKKQLKPKYNESNKNFAHITDHDGSSFCKRNTHYRSNLPRIY